MADNNKAPLWGLAALSWLVSFYFLYGFILNVGLPPSRNIVLADAFYASLWLFFLFLPFFNKIKIGKWIELERELSKTQGELREFKTDIRNTMTVLSTTVNTIGNLSNQVTVNLPGLGELEALKRKIDDQGTPKTKKEAEDIRADLLLESEDTVMALARTRIKIEYLLRKILGKRSVNALRDDVVKYMGVRQMFNMFVKENPQYEFLVEPFLYVNQVCNAAIHAQRVPEEKSSEALDLGSRILAVLSDIAVTNEN